MHDYISADAPRPESLRKAARNQICIRCGNPHGVVLAHYTGVRRLDFRGGLGLKVHDLIGAHLCLSCHIVMDQTGREHEKRWEHSEEFEYLVLKTILRLVDQGLIEILRPL